MCADKPRSTADRKLVSLLYLSVGVEKKTDSELQEPAYNDRYVIHSGNLEDCRSCNFTTQEHKIRSSCLLDHETSVGEDVEHFYGKLKELVENCYFENKEETLLHDVFIPNLIDPEIQWSSINKK